MQGLIRLLSLCAKGSPLGVKTLLHLEISGILKDILPVSSLVGSVSVNPSLGRTPDQVIPFVSPSHFPYILKYIMENIT